MSLDRLYNLIGRSQGYWSTDGETMLLVPGSHPTTHPHLLVQIKLLLNPPQLPSLHKREKKSGFGGTFFPEKTCVYDLSNAMWTSSNGLRFTICVWASEAEAERDGEPMMTFRDCLLGGLPGHIAANMVRAQYTLSRQADIAGCLMDPALERHFATAKLEEVLNVNNGIMETWLVVTLLINSRNYVEVLKRWPPYALRSLRVMDVVVESFEDPANLDEMLAVVNSHCGRGVFAMMVSRATLAEC